VFPATGVVTVTTGATVSILNVTAALTPTSPALSDCDACTVYVPSTSALDAATDHAPPDAVVDNDATGVPDAALPEYTRTVTPARSPDAVPALPANTGFETRNEARATGEDTDTTGAASSITSEARAVGGPPATPLTDSARSGDGAM
jgi:hypothetical protein